MGEIGPGRTCIKKRVCLGMSKKKKDKGKKRTALVVGARGREYWTTQAEFWGWVRSGVVAKTGDGPLRGVFTNEDEEQMVVLSNTVLNLAAPNHLREALLLKRNAYLR